MAAICLTLLCSSFPVALWKENRDPLYLRKWLLCGNCNNMAALSKFKMAATLLDMPFSKRDRCRLHWFLYLHFVLVQMAAIFNLWSAVAQLVECRTRNRESPGSNPRCYRFEVWAFSFTSRRLSRLSCINEYLAIDSGGNASE